MRPKAGLISYHLIEAHYLISKSLINGPYSYSRNWTGTSLKLRLIIRRVFSNANIIYSFLMIVLRMWNTFLQKKTIIIK